MRAGWRTAPLLQAARTAPDARPGEFDRVCDYQKFPAPDGPVRTVAGAVECHRDDRCAQAPAIGEQRNGVGMVVLHRDDGLAAGLPVRPRGGGIPGVQVTGEDVGSAAGHAKARWFAAASKQVWVRGSAMSPRWDDR